MSNMCKNVHIPLIDNKKQKKIVRKQITENHHLHIDAAQVEDVYVNKVLRDSSFVQFEHPPNVTAWVRGFLHVWQNWWFFICLKVLLSYSIAIVQNMFKHLIPLLSYFVGVECKRILQSNSIEFASIIWWTSIDGATI